MKRLFILLALLALCTMPVQAVEIVCTPAAGAYNETGYISCSFPDYSVLLGGDAANQSMRWYWTNTGRYGTVFKEITNPDNSHPFNGGWQTGFFQPPHTNFTPGVILMTYGTTANPNTQTQNLYTSVATGFAGFYSYGTYTFNYSIAQPPTANFTGSPTAGTLPLHVTFTDTSENETGTCTYNWTITPSTNVTGNTGTSEGHSAYFGDAGNYTVSHGVDCDGASDIETKTDYIWAYAPNETETTYFYTYNPLSGYEIHNSNIYLNDIENGSWVNSTDDADGRLGITALSTHHINAYSDKEGFGDGELLNQIANGLSYPLIMFPSNVTNVSAGNVTLYINVIDTWAPGTPVSGATVSITYAWPAIQYGTTNEAGMISFTVPNNTLIQVAANKAGYTGVSDSVNSGTGSGGEASVSKTLYITKKTVTTAPTPTTLPGGGTPTPQVTYLEHCDPSAADYDEALCRASKGGVGLNLLADYMDDLILLCIFVTIMYLLGFKLGS